MDRTPNLGIPLDVYSMQGLYISFQKAMEIIDAAIVEAGEGVEVPTAAEIPIAPETGIAAEDVQAALEDLAVRIALLEAATADVDPPVISTAGAFDTPENAVWSITLGANEPVTWSKVGGADAALFTLSGATLSLAAKDRENPVDSGANNTYVVTVRATDLAGNTADKTITVTVTDVDEDPPTITTSATFSHPENSPWSTTLAANEAVIWSKVAGADAALFTLAGSTLSLPAQDYESPADADGNRTYIVTVRATDGAGNQTDKTITVTITDVDDTAPSITTSGTQTVAENTAFSVGLTANETVTWSKVGGADAALFTLSGSTLSMAAKDYESPTDSNADNAYVVTVRATDGAGNFTDRTITVTVTNVDDTAPTITSSATQTVAENSAFSMTLTANESVTWSKVGGADTALFTLSGATLSMTAKDYEVPSDANGDNAYVVTVRATDGAGNHTDQTITVTVTNVADYTPTATDELFVRFNSLSAVDAYGKKTVTIANASVINTGPNGNAVKMAGGQTSYVDYGPATDWQFLWLATGDYTVEMIVRSVADPNYDVFGNIDGTSQIGACLSYRGTDQWTWDVENNTPTRAARVDAPAGIGNEANWTHVAIVKQSTTFKLYINGTLQRTVTGGTFSTGDGTGQKRMRSGCHSNNLYYTNMEIDSIRIKREVVYTANFTAPTALSP